MCIAEQAAPATTFRTQQQWQTGSGLSQDTNTTIAKFGQTHIHNCGETYVVETHRPDTDTSCALRALPKDCAAQRMFLSILDFFWGGGERIQEVPATVSDG